MSEASMQGMLVSERRRCSFNNLLCGVWWQKEEMIMESLSGHTLGMDGVNSRETLRRFRNGHRIFRGGGHMSWA